jgi:hypothetical protein
MEDGMKASRVPSPPREESQVKIKDKRRLVFVPSKNHQHAAVRVFEHGACRKHRARIYFSWNSENCFSWEGEDHPLRLKKAHRVSELNYREYNKPLADIQQV